MHTQIFQVVEVGYKPFEIWLTWLNIVLNIKTSNYLEEAKLYQNDTEIIKNVFVR